MTSVPEIFHVGDDRLLCDEWHAPSRTVVLRPSDPRRRLHPESIVQVLRALDGRGVTRVLTAALDPASLEPFAAAGFVVHENLCVLRHDLTAIPPSTSTRTRRGSPRRDLAVAAQVDERAFVAGGALDDGGLRAILAATPVGRFRLVDGPATPRRAVAYLLSGIAGDTGYVQRLAVDPDWRRRGGARALLVDALHWFARRHVAQVLVNTQLDNAAARQLYGATGFATTDTSVAVWAWHRTRA